MRTIVKLLLAGLLLACGSVHAENPNNPFYNGTIKISGMDQARFSEAVHQYELKGNMTPSSQKELGQLFMCFDADNSGVIEAEEAEGLFGKKKKKRKGGGGGTSCEYSTCDCDVLGDGQIISTEGTDGPTDTGSTADSGGRSPTWCGANCHCHCNTLTCAADGT